MWTFSITKWLCEYGHLRGPVSPLVKNRDRTLTSPSIRWVPHAFQRDIHNMDEDDTDANLYRPGVVSNSPWEPFLQRSMGLRYSFTVQLNLDKIAQVIIFLIHPVMTF